MHFVRVGQVELHYNEDRVLLSRGDLFCLFPHHTYIYKVVSAEEPLQMIWFAFNGAQSPMMLSMLGLSPETPYLCNRMTAETELVLQQMIKCMKNRDDGERFAMYSLIFKLFGELMPHRDNGSRLSSMTNWVDKSIDFMKMHYAEKLSVKDVADYVGIHRSYFSKVFTETIGIPPIKYLQQLRLVRASDLLRQTALSITEIALTVGYPDLYSFTRAFKAHYSVPPKRFRDRPGRDNLGNRQYSI
jgi:AraC-like DNA-binding protein